MIRVNGIPLDNPAAGWIFRSGSIPYTGFDVALTQVQVAGRDGHVPTSLTLNAPLWPLKVNTPPSGWESLLALFRSPKLVLTRDDNPGVEVACRLASSTPDRVYARNQWIDATFIVELTGAYWRDKAETTTPLTLTTASHTLSVFPDLSAPVQDAIIRVKGAVSGLQITDASGAWVTLPPTAAGQWTRFESDTGRCFLTATDTWTGGTDVSGGVDFGGPRNVFEITHTINAATLARTGLLTVTSATRSGAVVEVRGKAAHAL